MFCLSLFAHSALGAEVSVTMDDFDLKEQAVLSAKERNEKILAALDTYKAKAALFVIGGNIRSDEDRALLRAWPADGHIIGNHTFSHRLFSNNVTAEWEQQDILDCENVLSKEMGFEKLFRFPMLVEGNTREKRDAVRD